MKRRGFTLIELGFVISIIAVLAAILFPVFAGARETARRTSCASNLSQLGTALNMYAQNYDGHYPKRNNEFAPVYPFARCVDIFFCPSDPAEHRWNIRISPPGGGPMRMLCDAEVPTQTYSSYVYRGGLCNDDRADTIIAGEAQAWHHDLANVLHIAGYVKGVFAEGYKPVVAPTQKPVEEPRAGRVPMPPAPGSAP